MKEPILEPRRFMEAQTTFEERRKAHEIELKKFADAVHAADFERRTKDYVGSKMEFDSQGVLLTELDKKRTLLKKMPQLSSSSAKSFDALFPPRAVGLFYQTKNGEVVADKKKILADSITLRGCDVNNAKARLNHETDISEFQKQFDAKQKNVKKSKDEMESRLTSNLGSRDRAEVLVVREKMQNAQSYNLKKGLGLWKKDAVQTHVDPVAPDAPAVIAK